MEARKPYLDHEAKLRETYKVQIAEWRVTRKKQEEIEKNQRLELAKQFMAINGSGSLPSDSAPLESSTPSFETTFNNTPARKVSYQGEEDDLKNAPAVKHNEGHALSLPVFPTLQTNFSAPEASSDHLQGGTTNSKLPPLASPTTSDNSNSLNEDTTAHHRNQPEISHHDEMSMDDFDPSALSSVDVSLSTPLFDQEHLDHLLGPPTVDGD